MENTPRSKKIFFDQRVSSFSTGYIEVTLMVRYASSGGDGGSDDDEMPEDVRARRRGKVMAKNQAKRDQESRWEAARVQNSKPTITINEETFMQKTYQKVLNAANVLPGMSAWREEKEGTKKNTGGKSMAVPVRDGDPPEYKKLNWFWKWLVGGPAGCTLSLQECFNKYSLAEFSPAQEIDPNEFDKLVKAVYYDLKSHNPNKYNPFDWWVRSHYDTPFWNGTYVYKDPNTNEYVRAFRNDTIVCVNGVCDNRSDINYFAQGMWDAAMDRTLEESIQTAADRKMDEYGEEISERTIYWITYGYDGYQSLDTNSEGLQP